MSKKMRGKTALEWFNIGLDYYKSKNNQKAVECFDKAVRIDPQYKEAWFNMGLCLSGQTDRYMNEMRKYDMVWIRDQKAIKYFEQVVRIDPQNKADIAIDAWAWIILGEDRRQKPDQKATECFKKAVECFEKVLQIDPQDKETWKDLGNFYSNLFGDLKGVNTHQKAVECFEKALQIDPQDKEAWKGLGGAYIILKNYQKASEIFKKMGISKEEIEGNIQDALMASEKGEVEEILQFIEDGVDLSEKMEKITEYICPKCHCYYALAEGQICPICMKWEKEAKNAFEKGLIEFIEPYQKVAIETIAEHFFPLRIVWHSYEDFYKDVRRGWEPPGYYQAKQIIEAGIKKVRETLERLINTKKISGYIRPFGGVNCYINPGEVIPAISQIHIGDETTVQTGNISIQIGERKYCPNCGYKIEESWKTCPQCTVSLKKPINGRIYCTNCGEKIQAGWKVCPYCSSKTS